MNITNKYLMPCERSVNHRKYQGSKPRLFLLENELVNDIRTNLHVTNKCVSLTFQRKSLDQVFSRPQSDSSGVSFYNRPQQELD